MPIKDLAQLPAATEQSSFRTPENVAHCGERPEFHSGLDNFLKKLSKTFIFAQLTSLFISQNHNED